MREKPVAGLEKMDHIKTTQADCKWAWEQTAGGGAGTGWWLGEARSQQPSTRRSDSTYPIIHTALSLSGAIMGFHRMFFFFFSWLTLFVTDSYLHWLTLRELAACWEGGGRQANWLSSSWLMAGFRRKRQACGLVPFFSADRLQMMNPAVIIWQRCMNSVSWFSLCLFHKHMDVMSHH